ncbi:MAG: hypothetical protein POELPBGB_00175 [Bacteroidia bacterium]|nr:hypothetical protein [Bacteroidia bacterium]
MKNVVAAFLVFLACSQLCFGQADQSLLYNDKGQLKFDTTLSISKIQLQKWIGVEDSFIAELNHIKYLPMAAMDDIKGDMILRFEVDSTGKVLNIYHVKKLLGIGNSFETKNIINNFSLISSLKPERGTYIYYLPFAYRLVDTNKFIKENNAIPVTGQHFHYIQY